MAAANGSMSTRKASWPSSEASGTNSVAVPAASKASAIAFCSLIVNRMSDSTPMTSARLGRGALQRGGRAPPCADDVEAVHGARQVQVAVRIEHRHELLGLRFEVVLHREARPGNARGPAAALA